MAISAQDATLLFRPNRGGVGVAMQEVQQYALTLDLSNVFRFNGQPIWGGGTLGSLRILAFANNAVTTNDYGFNRFLTITHGVGPSAVTTFNGWVKVRNVSAEAIRADVLRYQIDMDVIWIVF